MIDASLSDGLKKKTRYGWISMMSGISFKVACVLIAFLIEGSKTYPANQWLSSSTIATVTIGFIVGLPLTIIGMSMILRANKFNEKIDMMTLDMQFRNGMERVAAPSWISALPEKIEVARKDGPSTFVLYPTYRRVNHGEDRCSSCGAQLPSARLERVERHLSR